jgi:uncharacterized protein YkwD
MSNCNPQMMDRWRRRTAVVAMWGGLLAACGGGGSGDPPAAAPVPSAATPLSSSVVDCGFGDFRASVLARVNQVRAAGATCGSNGTFGPAGPLAWNDRLTAAAVGHSQDMATNNYFAHVGRDGRTFTQRIDAAGYAWRTAGENLAAGQRSVNSVVDGWMASPGHCVNLMNPAFTEIGVACVPAASASFTYTTYWTMELGSPR